MIGRYWIILWVVALLAHCSPKHRQDSNIEVAKFVDQIRHAETVVRSTLSQTAGLLSAHVHSQGLHGIAKEYSTDEIGVIANHQHTLRSNAYINAGVSIDAPLKRYLARTDHLEDFWEINKRQYGSLISWQYTYHLKSNTIRAYPWHDFSKLFGPSTSWSLVRYFKNLPTVHRYEGKPFCTRPYDDAGGTGLNISCCSIFNPTNQYEDIILTCADVSFRDKLEALRETLALTKSCVRKLYMTSSAPPFAYKKDVIYDLRSGTLYSEDDLSDKINQTHLNKPAHFDLLTIDVYVETECP